MNCDVLSAITILVVLCGGLWSEGGAYSFAADLNDSLKPLIEAHAGDVAVCIRQLETGEQFVWRGDEIQPTASLIKMPVMAQK